MSEIGDRECVVHLSYPEPTEEECLLALGGLKGVMEFARKEATVVEKECMLKGARECTYQITWE